MASGITSSKSMSAFTLAEVLITLGIIGIVAEITIPVLMQNMADQQTVGMLKKEYSVLSQAYTMAVQENGTPDNWGLTPGNSPQILNMLKPYLKVSKDCIDASSGCWPAGINYPFLSPSAGYYHVIDDMVYPKLSLVDGTTIMGYANSTTPTCNTPTIGSTPALSNTCGNYYIDINGYKPPNKWGKDLFMFYITKNGIIPSGTQQEIYYPFTDCDKDTGRGIGCAAWVLYNENRDYLKCSGLSWDGPIKCP